MKLVMCAEEEMGKGVTPFTLAPECTCLKSVAGGTGWQRKLVLINHKKNESNERK